MSKGTRSNAPVPSLDFQGFKSEMRQILGYCDAKGQITLNMFGGRTTGTPQAAINTHERIHQQLLFHSSMGSFQRLLALALEWPGVPAEHRDIYANVLEKSFRSTFFIQEGCAVYGSITCILPEAPDQEKELFSSLPSSYQQAYRLVRAVLPDPAPEGVYVTCAIFLGILVNSPPVLFHYADWDRLCDGHLRYIDYDSPDDTLNGLAQNPGPLRRALREFISSEGTWDHFAAMVNNAGLGSHILARDEIPRQGAALAARWKERLLRQGLSYIRNFRPEVLDDIDASTNHTRVISETAVVEANATIAEVRSVQEGEIQQLVQRIKKTSEPVIIGILDKEPNRSSYTMSLEKRHTSRWPRWLRHARQPGSALKVTLDRSVQAYFAFARSVDVIMNPEADFTDGIDWYTAWFFPSELDLLDKSITRPGVFWFVDSAAYEMRKQLPAVLRPGEGGPAGYKLTNVFVRERHVEDLLSHLPFTPAGCLIIPFDPMPACLAFSGSEFHYAFTDESGTHSFQRTAQRRGHRPLRWIPELGTYGSLDYLVRQIYFIEHAFVSLIEQ